MNSLVLILLVMDDALVQSTNEVTFDHDSLNPCCNG